MKRYEKFSKDPLSLAEYITNKIGFAIKAVTEKTGNRF